MRQHTRVDTCTHTHTYVKMYNCTLLKRQHDRETVLDFIANNSVSLYPAIRIWYLWYRNNVIILYYTYKRFATSLHTNAYTYIIHTYTVRSPRSRHDHVLFVLTLNKRPKDPRSKTGTPAEVRCCGLIITLEPNCTYTVHTYIYIYIHIYTYR
jgi:hypothetical protein